MSYSTRQSVAPDSGSRPLVNPSCLRDSALRTLLVSAVMPPTSPKFIPWAAASCSAISRQPIGPSARRRMSRTSRVKSPCRNRIGCLRRTMGRIVRGAIVGSNTWIAPSIAAKSTRSCTMRFSAWRNSPSNSARFLRRAEMTWDLAMLPTWQPKFPVQFGEFCVCAIIPEFMHLQRFWKRSAFLAGRDPTALLDSGSFFNAIDRSLGGVRVRRFYTFWPMCLVYPDRLRADHPLAQRRSGPVRACAR